MKNAWNNETTRHASLYSGGQFRRCFTASNIHISFSYCQAIDIGPNMKRLWLFYRSIIEVYVCARESLRISLFFFHHYPDESHSSNHPIIVTTRTIISSKYYDEWMFQLVCVSCELSHSYNNQRHMFCTVPYFFLLIFLLYCFHFVLSPFDYYSMRVHVCVHNNNFSNNLVNR